MLVIIGIGIRVKIGGDHLKYARSVVPYCLILIVAWLISRSDDIVIGGVIVLSSVVW